jgi:hypothetical protein
MLLLMWSSTLILVAIQKSETPFVRAMMCRLLICVAEKPARVSTRLWVEKSWYLAEWTWFSLAGLLVNISLFPSADYRGNCCELWPIFIIVVPVTWEDCMYFECSHNLCCAHTSHEFIIPRLARSLLSCLDGFIVGRAYHTLSNPGTWYGIQLLHFSYQTLVYETLFWVSQWASTWKPEGHLYPKFNALIKLSSTYNKHGKVMVKKVKKDENVKKV